MIENNQVEGLLKGIAITAGTGLASIAASLFLVATLNLLPLPERYPGSRFDTSAEGFTLVYTPIPDYFKSSEELKQKSYLPETFWGPIK